MQLEPCLFNFILQEFKHNTNNISANSAKVICKVISVSLALASHRGNFEHVYLLT